jgi:DNA polymerase-3 subunit epsilon
LREIVLDTETTGLDPAAGHRVVEIGCIELVNHVPTGTVYQTYLNPEREMPEGALAVHGLNNAFLAQQPRFADVADAFLAFVVDAVLVAHNAEFDLGFLNEELRRIGRPRLPHVQVVDTVALARRKYPGMQASLDALCRRFGIDNSAREKHGALLDADLLAQVYLYLVGGRQPALGLSFEVAPVVGAAAPTVIRLARPHAPSPPELGRHATFVATLDNPIWLQ